MKHDPEQCSTCRYWLQSKQDPDAGSCRITHPTVVGDYKNTQTIFPQTKPTTWCGEYVAGATVHLPQSYQELTAAVPNPLVAPPEPIPEPTAIVGRDAPIPEPEAPIPPMPEVDVEKPLAKKK